MNARIPANLDELVNLAKGTKHESIARDPKQLEELLLKEMKKSDDPMTREIGSGLADGTMTWRTLATNSAYAEFLDSAQEAVRLFDYGAAFEEMAAEQARAENPPERRRRPAEEPADDPLFSGGLLKKRKPR